MNHGKFVAKIGSILLQSFGELQYDWMSKGHLNVIPYGMLLNVR